MINVAAPHRDQDRSTTQICGCPRSTFVRIDPTMEIEWTDSNDRLHRKRVPAHIDAYVDLMGLDRAAEFLILHGGTYYGPSERFNQGENRSVFAEFLTDEERQALYDHFGPGTIRLPLPKPFLVRYLRSRGKPQSEITRTLKITDVSIRRILNDELSIVREASR